MGETKKTISRRTFIALGGGVIGSLAAAAGCGPKKAPEQQAESKPQETAISPGKYSTPFPEDISYAGFRMGAQSWCFREFKSIDTLIDDIHALGLAHVEIAPPAHLPVETPIDQVKAVAEKFKNAGITVDACGVVGMENNEASCRQIFEYAKALGVIAISAAPQYDALPLVDKLTAEYGIPIGIHNHGPEDKLYRTPDMFRQHLAGTSTRIGLCVDLGHFNRAGVDPMAVINEFSDRITGIHLKDMVQGPDGKWVDAIVGRGKVNLPILMAKLKEIGFNGYFSLEYESDPTNPLPAMKECLEEIKKAAATLA